jgi:predicted DNA-binding protein
MSAIGVRIPDELLEKLDRLSDEQGLDRSTVIRQLIEIGYDEFMLDEAADRYRRGDITLSEAADIAGCTLWELLRHLVQDGYVSDYSIAELERERETLRAARDS